MSHGHDTFIVKGFDNWNKVCGKECAFMKHIKSSHHRDTILFGQYLLYQEAHVDNSISKPNKEIIMKNRFRLKTTIDVVRWLTYQTCALRGHDESASSKNRGNFLELLTLLTSYNDEISKVILENAPYNANKIQKEILSIIANKIRKHIRSEVGGGIRPFVSWLMSHKMSQRKRKLAIVVRFVDLEGMIQEMFLDLVHVRDTLSATLKTSLWKQLLHYQFDVSKIHGQGYEGASNMRGKWNGLQTLVLEECPYAYYVHYFAHRLKLALVCASREVIPVHKFFTYLVDIVNVACASSKRHDELQKAQVGEVKKLLDEINSGKGQNQLGTFRRAGDTRWGSHYNSICNLIKMFDSPSVVLAGIFDDVAYTTFAQRGDAKGA